MGICGQGDRRTWGQHRDRGTDMGTEGQKDVGTSGYGDMGTEGHGDRHEDRHGDTMGREGWTWEQRDRRTWGQHMDRGTDVGTEVTGGHVGVAEGSQGVRVR